MKRLLQHIFLSCATACMLVACFAEGECPGGVEEPTGDDIVLNFTITQAPISRADQVQVQGVGVENAVEHLDVLIFEESTTGFDADNKRVHYERIEVKGANSGKIFLNAKRQDFNNNGQDPTQKYWVYLVANSTMDKNVWDANIKDVKALKELTDTNYDIHVTGDPSASGAEQKFLMDGIAYVGNGTEPAEATPIVLNDGQGSSKNTELSVTLRRAAAKIVVTINKGESTNIKFAETQPAQAGYYLLHMPVKATVVAGGEMSADEEENKLKSSDPYNGTYFKWGVSEGVQQNQIVVQGYAYPHDWGGTEIYTNQVSMIVNIPISYNGTEASRNFYMIPISKEHVLKRNHLYTVNVTINTKGAESEENAIQLNDIRYSAIPMEEVHFNVGVETNKVAYLTLNHQEMEMHDISKDTTTMEFTSSSEITNVSIDSVYYYNKYGVKTNITTATGTTNNKQNYYTYTDPETGRTSQKLIRDSIQIVPAQGMNGKITIKSPVPQNNTIRYIKVKVTNRDGLIKSFTIKQYPLVYITNIQGWYSYRDDFGGTTYQERGAQGVVGISYTGKTADNKPKYEYYYNTYYSYSSGLFGGTRTEWSTNYSPFWRSRVAVGIETDLYNTGKSDVATFYWTNQTTSQRKTNSTSKNNAKMYHVRVTATSNEYTLGKPRLNSEGYTDDSEENAQLVSPSFMIASRLGVVTTDNVSPIDLDTEENTYTQEEYDLALAIIREHCKQYVEVYIDENGNPRHLKDWRLPTDKELGIIIGLQGGSDDENELDAIDFLLNAKHYWSARKPIRNTKSTTSGTSIRCIRDADETDK